MGVSDLIRTPSPAAMIITTWLMGNSTSGRSGAMRPWLGG